MQAIDIHGKKYYPVSERISEFRTNEKYKGYRLLDEIIDKGDTFVVIRAYVHNENGETVATGIAREEKSASKINQTSFYENCETSAWGRALANLGIGTDAEVASADEVRDAIETQELRKTKIDKNHIGALLSLITQKGADENKIMETYHIEKFEEMVYAQWEQAMRILEKRPDVNLFE